MRDKLRSVVRIVLILLLTITGLYILGRLSLVTQRLRATYTPNNLLLKSGIPLVENSPGVYVQDPAYFWGKLETGFQRRGIQGNLLAKSGAGASYINHDQASTEKETGASAPADVQVTREWYDLSITVEEALAQVPRVARARQLDENEVAGLVIRYTQGNLFGLLGPSHINVRDLNRALDSLEP